jgi:hypothetical protein
MVGKAKKQIQLRLRPAAQYWCWLALLIPVIGVTGGLFNRLVHITHDINTFLWSRAVYELMEKGVWYPHWLPQLWYGFGLPVLYFYPPLFYWLAGGLQVIGLPTVLAINVLLIISALIGGVFVFLWAKEWVSQPAALLTAGLWLWSPYYLSLIYTRGAFPEFVALNLIPILMWFTMRLWREPRAKYWIGVVISFSLIVLTHSLTTVIALAIYLIYLGYLTITERRSLTTLTQSSSALVATWLITGFYWLPMLAYHNVINTKILTADGFDYGRNFPELGQLLNINLSPDLGWLTLGLIPAATLILGWLTQSEILERQLRRRLLFCLVLASGFLLLVVPYGAFIWSWIPGLAIFQFPTRFLGVACLFLAMVAGLILDGFIDHETTKLRVAIGALVVAGMMAIPFAVPRYNPSTEQLGRNSDNFNIVNYMTAVFKQSYDNVFDKSIKIDRGVVSYEYLPRKVTEAEGNKLFIKMLEEFSSPDTNDHNNPLLPPSKLKFQHASTQLETLLDTPTDSKFVITNIDGEEIRINQFEFPTWRFLLNGAMVTPTIKSGEPGQFLELPIGKNTLEIKLIQTAPMRWGQIISLLGVALTGFWFWQLKRKTWAKVD